VSTFTRFFLSVSEQFFRVKVHSVALNPVDAYYVAHPVVKTPGRMIGSDLAGTIVKIGADVTEWGVGDRVAAFLKGGTREFLILLSLP
jgi:NADPH:quinone reductase-like Zn-dependent oxidoreductase